MDAERKNLIQPADWWRAFEKAAAEKGESLAEWMGKQCRKSLPKEVRDTLSERRTRGKQKAVSENP